MRKEISKILEKADKWLEKFEYDKAETVLVSCKLYSFEEDAYIKLAYVFFKLSDYISAEEIYKEIAEYYDKQRKISPLNLMIDNSLRYQNFCKELKKDTSHPIYRKLSDKAKGLIQVYNKGELSKEIQQVLAKDFNAILNDVAFYGELKSYWESYRNTYSPNGHKLRDIVTGQTGQYMDALTCLEKPAKKLTAKEKIAMKKLNKLLLWEQYPIKTREEYFGALYNGVRENIYFIRSKKYFAEQKYVLAIDKLKTARKLYLERNWRRAIFDESKWTYIFHLVPRDFKLIEQIEMFSSLEEIIKLKSLTSIKEETEEINQKILSKKEEKSSRQEKKGILGLFMAREEVFDDLYDLFPNIITKTTTNCIIALRQAFNFEKVNYNDLSRLSEELISKNLIDVKKFVDAIVNYCFQLQKYSNMNDALEHEEELLKEFQVVGERYNGFRQVVREELGAFRKEVNEEAEKRHSITRDAHTKEIKKAIKEPVESKAYKTRYRITIRKDLGGKGTLFIHFGAQNYGFPLTPVQFQLMKALGKKMKADKKLHPNEQGWMSWYDISKNVDRWKSSPADYRVRMQINRIKDKISKDSRKDFDVNLLATQPGVGYRISTHPDNITIK